MKRENLENAMKMQYEITRLEKHLLNINSAKESPSTKVKIEWVDNGKELVFIDFSAMPFNKFIEIYEGFVESKIQDLENGLNAIL